MTYKRVKVRKRVMRDPGKGLWCYSCRDIAVKDGADKCHVCGRSVFYRGQRMSRIPFVLPSPSEVDDLPAIPARPRNPFLGRKIYRAS